MVSAARLEAAAIPSGFPPFLVMADSIGARARSVHDDSS
jgi:hypothetical protein